MDIGYGSNFDDLAFQQYKKTEEEIFVKSVPDNPLIRLKFDNVVSWDDIFPEVILFVISKDAIVRKFKEISKLIMNGNLDSDNKEEGKLFTTIHFIVQENIYIYMQ